MIIYRLLLGTLFLFGALYLFFAVQIQLDPWSAADSVNSRTLPMLYGSALCLAVLALAVTKRPAETGSHREFRFIKGPLLQLTLLIACFIFSLRCLNLWVALAGLLLCALWAMGERRWWIISAVTLGTPIGGFLLVEIVLQMSIPLS